MSFHWFVILRGSDSFVQYVTLKDDENRYSAI